MNIRQLAEGKQWHKLEVMINRDLPTSSRAFDFIELNTVLRMAAADNQCHIVSLLLKVGACLMGSNCFGCRAICLAVTDNCFQEIFNTPELRARALLFVLDNAEYFKDFSLLNQFISSGDFLLLDELIKAENFGDPLLYWLASREKEDIFEVFKTLIPDSMMKKQCAQAVTYWYIGSRRPIHEAFHRGHWRIFMTLFELYPNMADAQLYRPMGSSYPLLEESSVNRLLGFGADIDVMSKDKRYSLNPFYVIYNYFVTYFQKTKRCAKRANYLLEYNLLLEDPDFEKRIRDFVSLFCAINLKTGAISLDQYRPVSFDFFTRYRDLREKLLKLSDEKRLALFRPFYEDFMNPGKNGLEPRLLAKLLAVQKSVAPPALAERFDEAKAVAGAAAGDDDAFVTLDATDAVPENLFDTLYQNLLKPSSQSPDQFLAERRRFLFLLSKIDRKSGAILLIDQGEIMQAAVTPKMQFFPEVKEDYFSQILRWSNSLRLSNFNVFKEQIAVLKEQEGVHDALLPLIKEIAEACSDHPNVRRLDFRAVDPESRGLVINGP